jgi:hypothetical protein
VKRLAAVCDEMQPFGTKTVHASEQQLTYIRTVNEMTKQNMMDTL